MFTLLRLRLLAWIQWKRRPPAITISFGGQLTPRPQVLVSVWSMHGGIGVYCYDADPQGNAHAEMNARSLSHITGIRLIDERSTQQIPEVLRLKLYGHPPQRVKRDDTA